MDATLPPLRRNRPFQQLVIAKVANELSGAIGNLTLPLLVLLLSGSATLAGTALAISTVALIATQTLGGALVDRWSPSVTLRLSSFVQAAGWALVLAALFVPGVAVPLLLVGSVIAGGASGLDGPSEHALLKVIVPQSQLGQAAALSQGREAAAGLLGGPIGGFLYALAPAWSMVSQVALNALAGLVTPRVPAGAADEDAAPLGFFREVALGFSTVFRHPGLRGIAIVSGIANFPVVALPLVLIAEYQAQSVSPFLIGVLTSAFGVGMVIGAFIAGPLSTRVPLGVLGTVGLSAFALGQVVILFWHEQFWVATAALAISALPLPSFNAAISAYTAAVTPANLMGRVSAASGVPGMILMPVGMLVAGILFDAFGPFLPLAVSAAIAASTVVLMLAIRALREIPRLSELEEPGAEPAEV